MEFAFEKKNAFPIKEYAVVFIFYSQIRAYKNLTGWSSTVLFRSAEREPILLAN